MSEGSLIGKRQTGRNLRVSVTCTDGRDREKHSLAIPPAPPAAPVVELAELSVPAPLAVPSPKAAPAPKPAPAPLPAVSPLPPVPPAPMAPMATPLSPEPPLAGVAPVSPVAPIAPLSPQGISYSIETSHEVIEETSRTTSAFGVRGEPAQFQVLMLTTG